MRIRRKAELLDSITAATKLKQNSCTYKPNPPLNGLVHIKCKLLRYIVTSSAEAETTGLFHNCQKVIEIKQMLQVLGHSQGAVPVKTDNITAASFVTELKQKRNKSWDTRFHWLNEQQLLKKF